MIVPYVQPAPPTDRVPSLSWICLQRLADFPDQVHHLPVRLNYDPVHSDVLHGPQPIDPRLCVTLAQVYDNLPAHFHSITLPLADPHLNLLQRIPPTPRFSLLTILDLPACPHLTDTSIVALRPLHSLTAFDASATSISPYAIKALAGTLLWVDDGPDRRGPWPLRILRLRFCVNIDDHIYPHLSKFPLLSAIDLRGTNCRPAKDSAFQPSSDAKLFHPSPLAAAVDSLSGPDLYSSQNTFSLVIGTLNHPLDKTPTSLVIPQESYVFVPPRVKSEPKKDTPSGDYQLQPPQKRLIIPKDYMLRWAQEEDAFGHEGYDFDCGTPEYCDEDHCWSDDVEGSEGDGTDDGDEDDESDADNFQQQIVERLHSVPAPSANQPTTLTQSNDSALSTSPESDPRDHTTSGSAPEMFYLKPLLPLLAQKYDPEKNYSAEMYYARVHAASLGRPSNRHDAKLALYRTPPPWNMLQVHSEHLRNLTYSRSRPDAGGGKTGIGVATVNRAQIGRIEALRESASARRRTTQHQTPPLRNEASGSTQGRNPFRRQSTSALEGSSRGMKPLKPISAVEVPLLPAKLAKVQAPGVRTFNGNSKAAEADKMKWKANTITSTWAGLEQEGTAKKRSGAGAVKRIRVGDGPRRKANIGKGGMRFDWGAWGGGKV